MQVQLNLTLDSEVAKKIIRYAELLERVESKIYPSAENVDCEITNLLDNEDRRTARAIFLDKSKSFCPENCGNHKNNLPNADYCGCDQQDSSNCYDCDCWEPVVSNDV
jgi:hypothetical protein